MNGRRKEKLLQSVRQSIIGAELLGYLSSKTVVTGISVVDFARKSCCWLWWFTAFYLKLTFTLFVSSMVWIQPSLSVQAVAGNWGRRHLEIYSWHKAMPYWCGKTTRLYLQRQLPTFPPWGICLSVLDYPSSGSSFEPLFEVRFDGASALSAWVASKALKLMPQPLILLINHPSGVPNPVSRIFNH